MVENDPWGLPYQIVAGKLLGRAAPKHNLELDRELRIAAAFFPKKPRTDWSQNPPPTIDVEPTPFTTLDILGAARRFPSGKAAGPDGIISEILRAIASHKPELIIQPFNNSLKTKIFPDEWKEARLVLLHKGGNRDPSDPSSFRPISVINSAGKLMERLILTRLDEHLDTTPNGRNDNQYGFRRGWSTINAMERVKETANWTNQEPTQHRDICILVLIDVRNAFKSLPWWSIDEALGAKRTPAYIRQIIRSYLTGRSLQVNTSAVELSRGVPQRSVLGPTLWNVVYDQLLETPTGEGSQLLGFADDLTLIVTAKDLVTLENRTNTTLRTINEWMTRKGLEIAPQKTQAIVLSRRKSPPVPTIVLCGHQIPVVKEARYLGVTFDLRMTFRSHIGNIANSARGIVALLSKLMPNVGGPGTNKRRLIMSVTKSKPLYGAPIWANTTLKYNTSRGTILGAQRAAVLHITRAYRTVPRDAVIALAGTPPANLLAVEESRVSGRVQSDPNLPRTKARVEERARTIII